MTEFLLWLRQLKPGQVFLWIVVAFAGAIAALVTTSVAVWVWGHS